MTMSALVLSLSNKGAILSSADATAAETFCPRASTEGPDVESAESVSDDRSFSSDKETDVGLRSESIA